MTKIYFPERQYTREILRHASAIFELLESGTLETVTDRATADLIVDVYAPTDTPHTNTSGVSVGTAHNSAIGSGASVTNMRDVTGGNINIGGQQHISGGLNVNMSGTNNRIGESTLPDTVQNELRNLVTHLQSELAKLPADKQPEAEIVAELADEAITEVTQPKPKWYKVQIKGENLKQAAENLLAISPSVGALATAFLTKFMQYRAQLGG